MSFEWAQDDDKRSARIKNIQRTISSNFGAGRGAVTPVAETWIRSFDRKSGFLETRIDHRTYISQIALIGLRGASAPRRSRADAFRGKRARPPRRRVFISPRGARGMTDFSKKREKKPRSRGRAGNVRENSLFATGETGTTSSCANLSLSALFVAYRFFFFYFHRLSTDQITRDDCYLRSRRATDRSLSSIYFSARRGLTSVLFATQSRNRRCYIGISQIDRYVAS